MGVLYDGWGRDATEIWLIFRLGWLPGAVDGGFGGFGGYGKWVGRVGAGIVFLGTCGYGPVGEPPPRWWSPGATKRPPHAHQTHHVMMEFGEVGKYRIDNTLNA